MTPCGRNSFRPPQRRLALTSIARNPWNGRESRGSYHPEEFVALLTRSVGRAGWAPVRMGACRDVIGIALAAGAPVAILLAAAISASGCSSPQTATAGMVAPSGMPTWMGHATELFDDSIDATAV